MKQGIAWNSLPQTFQDAVTFTWALNIRYLWIDSLCIVQHDPEDWAVQSGTMASIFSNAFVTLAATASSDARGSLFRRLDEAGLHKEISSNDPDFITQVFSRRRTHLDGDRHWPLLSRGWVLQEHLLSQRVIHFNATELAWHCHSMVTCECTDPSPLPMGEKQFLAMGVRRRGDQFHGGRICL